VNAAVSAAEFKSVPVEMRLNLGFVGPFVWMMLVVVYLVCLIGLL
jgi:hypothetical protein